MTTVNPLQEAIDAMQRIIDAGPISAQAMDGATPCSKFSVSQLADHIIETHNFLLVAAGGTPPTTAGSMSDRHATVGAASVTQWNRRGTDGTIDLGGNEMPAAFGLSLHTLETYIHAWDLATSLGRTFDPSPELTRQMWDFAQSFITDDVRGDFDGAPYGPAIGADDTEDLTSRIVALSGRDPSQTFV